MMSKDTQIKVSDLPSVMATTFYLYDMTIVDVLSARRYEVVTNRKIDDRSLKPISLYAPSHYNFQVTEMVKEFDVSKRNVLAALVTLGLAIMQHRHNPTSKKMSEIRTRIYRTNFPLAVELFGHTENIFVFEEGRRRHNNAYVDGDTIAAPLGEMAEYFCMSGSELAAIACAQAILTWESLPESAVPVFRHDVELFENHVKWMLERGKPYLQDG